MQSNDAASGGGIYGNAGEVIVTESCTVTRNTAPSSQGGGIYRAGATVTLQDDDPSSIVINNCQENCAGDTVAGCSTEPPVGPCA